jgi:hypothetical protein
VEIKDSTISPTVQALIDGRDGTVATQLAMLDPGYNTVTRPVTVAFVTAGNKLQDPSADSQDPNDAADSTGLEEPMLTLTLSSEPESFQELETQPGPDAVIKSGEEAREQSLNRDEMIAFIIQHDDSETDQGVERLMAGLTITEAMIPGFIAQYWKQRKDEQDELDAQLEEQERAREASPGLRNNGRNRAREDDTTDDSD